MSPIEFVFVEFTGEPTSRSGRCFVRLDVISAFCDGNVWTSDPGGPFYVTETADEILEKLRQAASCEVT